MNAPALRIGEEAETQPTRQFAAVAADLAGPRENIESAFLDVGGKLGQAIGMLKQISAAFEELSKDFASPELAEASAGLEALAFEARRIASAFAKERADMARLGEAVSAARNPISDLERTIKVISIVAINARVVAASVADAMDGIDVFTSDIAELSNEVGKAVSDFARIYGQLVDSVEKASDQHAAFESLHCNTLSRLADGIVLRLQGIAEQRDQSAQASVRTGRMSQEIGGRISEAVSALQIGDNARQRLEHVDAALTLLDDLCAGKQRTDMAEGFALPVAAKDGATSLVCRLQSAQLLAAASDFERETRSAELAFRELATSAKAIVQDGRNMYGQTSVTSKEAPLPALRSELQKAAALLRDCEAERKKFDAVACGIGNTVHSLVENIQIVQDIEFKMRLLSLKASAKCAQLGERGRALNVIAQQLRELTAATVVSADATIKKLNLAADLARIVAAAGESDTAGQVGSLEEEARRAMGLLETVDARLKSALSALEMDGTRVAELLALSANNFTRQAGIVSAIRQIDRRLQAEGIYSESEPHDIAVNKIMARLRKFYTMECERQLHDSLIGLEGDDSETAWSESEPACELF